MSAVAMTVTGVVLAGGQGRRMSADGSGTDKGLQPLRGRPLVAHAIERLAPQVDALLINANRHLDTYRTFGWPVVSDAIAGYAGPLAGLASALRVASTDWVITVPCDSPLLPADLLVRMAAAARSSAARVAVARTSEGEQPVFLLVERSLAGDLESWLGAGGRRIDAWYRRLAPAFADFPDARAFCNVNTPADLAALE
jgi:molybdopterin-guanine dinucleotide biosynthesis protein A